MGGQTCPKCLWLLTFKLYFHHLMFFASLSRSIERIPTGCCAGSPKLTERAVMVKLCLRSAISAALPSQICDQCNKDQQSRGKSQQRASLVAKRHLYHGRISERRLSTNKRSKSE